jgi:hypothetical protein
MNRGRPAGKLIGYGISAAIVNGKPSKLTGAASFALLGLLSFLPDGRSARRYNPAQKRNVTLSYSAKTLHVSCSCCWKRRFSRWCPNGCLCAKQRERMN